jgi:hypothetical protein
VSNKEGYIRIHWKEPATGREGVYQDGDDCPSVSRDEDGYWNLFWWTEGNAGCDCNRAIFFLGLDSEDPDNYCGSDRFIILKAEVRDVGGDSWEDVTSETVAS